MRTTPYLASVLAALTAFSSASAAGAQKPPKLAPDPVLRVLRAPKAITPGTAAHFQLQARFGGSPRRETATAFQVELGLAPSHGEKITQVGGEGEGWFIVVGSGDSAAWSWGHLFSSHSVAPGTVLPPIGVTVHIAADCTSPDVFLTFSAYAQPAGSASVYLTVPVRRLPGSA